MAVIGIDLGTTNSAIAYMKGARPVIIENENGDRTTPSAVSIELNGLTSVGSNAKGALTSIPDRVAVEVKRLMGTDEVVQLAGQAYRPEEISAMILRELKKWAEQRIGEKVTEAVITVPAYFSDAQRIATKKAGELAGLKVERILNEPTAAAIAYGLENMEKEEHILIYDFGGGTFDVSVVELFEGVLEVKASAGNNQLGGMDFDNVITDWLIAKVKAEKQIDLLETPSPLESAKIRYRIKEQAELVKKQLSSQVSARLMLPYITMKDGVPVSIEEEITRTQFERLVREMAESTLLEVEKALQDAGLESVDIDQVILVGGSTRIPLIQELVTKKFGKAPRKDINPDEAVALGAAIQAGIKSGAIDSSTGMMVTDVCPYTLGTDIIRMIGGQAVPGFFDPIITRNSTIPVTETKTYYTAVDNQTEVEVKVYQGDDPYAERNIFLQGQLLTGIPAMPAGEEEIEIKFHYDINGILQVGAKVLSTGKSIQMVITNPTGMSEEEVAAAKERLEQGWEQSDMYKDVKAVIYRAEKVMDEVDFANKSKIERLLTQLKQALSINDVQQVKRLEEELTDLLIELV